MSVELHHSCRAWPWLAGPIFLAFVAVGGALGCDAEEPAEPDASSVHPAVVPTPRSDAHSRERRAAIRERALSGDPVRLVLLGDSITERWGGAGVEIDRRELAPIGTANLGIDGDRTEHLLGRLHDGELDGIDPEVIVLLIGTNNLGRDGPEAVVAGIGAIVEWLHEARPAADLWLLALLPRGFAPDGYERHVVGMTNASLERAARTWPVTFIDVGHALLEPDGRLSRRVSPDGVHLSQEGYARWHAAMRPMLSKAFGEAEMPSPRGAAP